MGTGTTPDRIVLRVCRGRQGSDTPPTATSVLVLRLHVLDPHVHDRAPRRLELIRERRVALAQGHHECAYERRVHRRLDGKTLDPMPVGPNRPEIGRVPVLFRYV